jgi:hypothetical protein
MGSAKVVDRTRRAVTEVLRRQGYVSALDVFLEMGTLKQQDLEDWRFGRVPFLERKLMGSLGKLSTTLREMKRTCEKLGLKPSQTAYMKWGKGPKRRLRFSKYGEPHVEEAYRTHWVSQRVARQHSRRGTSPLTGKPNQAPSRDEPAASACKPPGHAPLPMLERDPARVEQLAERKWEENVRLRSFLKSGHLSDRDVDRRFRRLYEWVRTEIDCTACANCCKTLPIVVTRAEARRLAAVLEQSPKDFSENYLRTSEEGSITK